MSASRSIVATVTLAVVVAAPGLAFAQSHGITPASIFVDAAAPMQVIIIALLVAMIAAVIVTASKVMSGPHLNGGSAFLSALRLGAPLLGLFGAAFNGLMMFIGLSNVGPQPIDILAPGLAEASFLLALGVIVGVVAVIGHWAVESRIDRIALKT